VRTRAAFECIPPLPSNDPFGVVAAGKVRGCSFAAAQAPRNKSVSQVCLIIRFGRPDLEFGDINRRSIICTVGRADSDADTVKNRCRGQAVAKGKLKRISFVSSDEEHCLTLTVRNGTLDTQDESKKPWILVVYDFVRKVYGPTPFCRRRAAQAERASEPPLILKKTVNETAVVECRMLSYS
jgi:hypothetical protein